MESKNYELNEQEYGLWLKLKARYERQKEYDKVYNERYKEKQKAEREFIKQNKQEFEKFYSR